MGGYRTGYSFELKIYSKSHANRHFSFKGGFVNKIPSSCTYLSIHLLEINHQLSRRHWPTDQWKCVLLPPLLNVLAATLAEAPSLLRCPLFLNHVFYLLQFWVNPSVFFVNLYFVLPPSLADSTRRLIHIIPLVLYTYTTCRRWYLPWCSCKYSPFTGQVTR